MDGYVCRYERHLIYWKIRADGDVGIVTILHERMHQMDRFRDDFGVVRLRGDQLFRHFAFDPLDQSLEAQPSRFMSTAHPSAVGL